MENTCGAPLVVIEGVPLFNLSFVPSLVICKLVIKWERWVSWGRKKLSTLILLQDGGNKFVGDTFDPPLHGMEDRR